MIIIYNTATESIRREISENSRTQNLQTHTRSGYTLLMDPKQLTVRADESTLVAFHGVAFHNSKTLSPENHSSPADFFNSLKIANGSFFAILICPSKIRIARSLYRCPEIYYLKHGLSYTFSTDISYLLKLSDNSTDRLNTGHIAEFITGTLSFGGETAFLDVNEIGLGECFEVENGSALTRHFFNQPRISTHSIADEIVQCLAALTNRKATTKLMFSGGLDSGALLWALTKQSCDLQAVHTESTSYHRESEYLEALELANALGVSLEREFTANDSRFDLRIIQGEIRTPLNTPLFSALHDHESGPPDNCTILLGHGGDQVFVQNPPISSPFTALRLGKFLEFLRISKNLSELKKYNFFDIIAANLKLLLSAESEKIKHIKWLPRLQSINKRKHYLIENHPEKSARRLHARDILNALSTCAPVEGNTDEVWSPLLLQSVIAHAIETPLDRLFSGSYDRLTFRSAVADSSGMDFPWRRTKKPSSAYLFDVFQSSEKSLIEFIETGELPDLLSIDRDELQIEIKRNCSTGFSENLPEILNFLKMEKYIQKIKIEVGR